MSCQQLGHPLQAAWVEAAAAVVVLLAVAVVLLVEAVAVVLLAVVVVVVLLAVVVVLLAVAAVVVLQVVVVLLAAELVGVGVVPVALLGMHQILPISSEMTMMTEAEGMLLVFHLLIICRKKCPLCRLMPLGHSQRRQGNRQVAA